MIYTEDPLLDVAVMEAADAFTADCVSAFSAVAKRERPSGQENRLLGLSVIDNEFIYVHLQLFLLAMFN